MAKITRQTAKILPTPSTNKTRQRRIPGAPQRRSRGVAGVEPEGVEAGASSRHKKKVMRALDILGDKEGITQEALDRYSQMFTQPSSLVSSHAQVLAALFGWGIPDEIEVSQGEGL